jgi:hypothetical protein
VPAVSVGATVVVWISSTLIGVVPVPSKLIPHFQTFSGLVPWP